jgi:hypothetical protein
MKSAAVDCELSYKQNKDGTFRCLPLKGAVGDFLYNPVLAEDLAEGAKFDIEAAEKRQPRVTIQRTGKGKEYRMREVLGADESVTGFEIYAKEDVSLTKQIGTAGVKDGNPGPPVKLFN